jgi:ABC-type polysaccharide/polyol phosphate export permease
LIDAAKIPKAPPPELRYRHDGKLISALHTLFRRRELVRSLVQRDFSARYKQTVLGVGWSVVQPLAMILVLSVFVQRVAKANTHGAPYVLWCYMGLVPWTFFSSALNNGGMSLVNNQPLLNKVHCPREIFPTSAVVLAGIDALFSMTGLVALFVITGFVPRGTVYWVPLIVLIQVAFALGVALFAAIITVYLRDVRPMLPIILQLGLFASPVAWSLSQLPSRDRLIYCVLNPGGAVIDSLRRTVLYGMAPDWQQLGAAAASSVVVLVLGFRFFKRFELGIADII